MVKKKDKESEIVWHVEVITLPSGKFSWRSVQIYDDIEDLIADVTFDFAVIHKVKYPNRKGLIEIGGRVFGL